MCLGGDSRGGGGGARVQEGNVEADLIDPWSACTGLGVPIYSGSLDWSLPLSGCWPLLGDSPPLGPDLSLPEAGDAVQPPAVSVHLVPQLARVTVSHQGLETLDVGDGGPEGGHLQHGGQEGDIEDHRLTLVSFSPDIDFSLSSSLLGSFCLRFSKA